MIDPRTLRGQLALAYAAALLVALVLFAAATLALVDRTQRTTLDERLQVAARAIAAITDQRNGRLSIDETDRRQFLRIVGSRVNGAVFDVGGKTLASTVLRVPNAVRALATEHATSGVVTVRGNDEDLRVAVVAVPPGRRTLGVAFVWHDLDLVTDLDRRLTLAFGIAIPIIAAFAVVAGSAVAARGLRPLVAMAEIASEIEAHDLSRRIAIPPRDDELGRLVATFDRMLDRLQSAFERQRRFTGDASHELRAPLSVIRAEADLMLRRPRSGDEYRRALEAIAVQADDLEALTRDLLAAARAESAPADTRAVVDLAAIAGEAADRLAVLAGSRGIALARSLPPGALIRGDGDALRRATVCLLHNALKYGRHEGTVTVAVEADENRVRLVVADDGPGFSDAALDHATERFWRDDPARGRADGNGEASGSGLGLSIAAAIVQAAGGTLTLTNRREGGASAVVELPSAGPFIRG
ncbi:MAG: HAMP domain-containing histidine kinase [Candidatus Eremiobacteraeota bacterium]|nr:HAMP domain-containing histidine kinase [Candidatus Eremiobacteraeota bacterium]